MGTRKTVVKMGGGNLQVILLGTMLLLAGVTDWRFWLVLLPVTAIGTVERSWPSMEYDLRALANRVVARMVALANRDSARARLDSARSEARQEIIGILCVHCARGDHGYLESSRLGSHSWHSLNDGGRELCGADKVRGRKMSWWRW